MATSLHPAGRLSNLVLTAHRAGHTLGGTIWTLRSPTLPFSTDSILYAPIFNHVRDRHLDNTALLLGSSGEGMRVAESMRRPGVLITGAERARINNVKRKERDERLFGEERFAHDPFGPGLKFPLPCSKQR